MNDIYLEAKEFGWTEDSFVSPLEKLDCKNCALDIRLPLLCTLSSLVEGHSFDGWDGEDACALNGASFYSAVSFVEKLPVGMPMPDVQVDADGEVSFEWYKSPLQVCSITFASDGRYHCVLLDGEKEVATTTNSAETAKQNMGDWADVRLAA